MTAFAACGAQFLGHGVFCPECATTQAQERAAEIGRANAMMNARIAAERVGAFLRDLKRVNGVRGVHDLHVWSITQSMRSLPAHVATDDIPLSASAAIQREIKELLFHRYGIAHATLQFECAECGSNLLYCDLENANHHAHH